MIEFTFTFSPAKIYYYHENMARQYFSPFFFFSKLIKRLGSFFLFFDTSYQPVLVLDVGSGTLKPHFLVHGDGGGVALVEA